MFYLGSVPHEVDVVFAGDNAMAFCLDEDMLTLALTQMNRKVGLSFAGFWMYARLGDQVPHECVTWLHFSEFVLNRFQNYV